MRCETIVCRAPETRTHASMVSACDGNLKACCKARKAMLIRQERMFVSVANESECVLIGCVTMRARFVVEEPSALGLLCLLLLCSPTWVGCRANEDNVRCFHTTQHVSSGGYETGNLCAVPRVCVPSVGIPK